MNYALLIIASFAIAVIIDIIYMVIRDHKTYGTLHYADGELYLAVTDESLLDLKDGSVVTLKFQRIE